MLRLAIALLLAALTGCSGSAKQAIGRAAVTVQREASASAAELDSALATGEIGPTAEPLVLSARKRQDVIAEAAIGVQDNMANIEDREGWFSRLLRTSFWFVVIGGVVFVCIYFAPVLRPVLLLVGSWLNLIPRAIRIDARADAEAIVADKAGKSALSKDDIRAIETKKIKDARYRKALETELSARKP